jgi:superfamily II DNA or RNA helicase
MNLFENQKVRKKKIELRDYQSKITDDILKAREHGFSRIMVASPTGSGKTVIFSSYASDLSKLNRKVMVVTHRVELLTQTSGTFSNFNIHAEILNTDTKIIPHGGDVVVSMIETLYRRLENKEGYIEFLNSFDTIILDEAHTGQFDKLFQHLTEIPLVLGFSATPYRRNPQTPLSAFYDHLIIGPSVKDLIKKGFLSKSLVFGQRVDLSAVGFRSGEYKPEDIESSFEAQGLFDTVVDNYVKYTKGKKTLLFTPTVSASIEITDRFRKAGIAAAHVDAETPKELRRKIFHQFHTGDIEILSNQGIAGIGFDEPEIEIVLLFRATTSLTLYLQMIGRGSRITENKSTFIVLDYGNNTSRFGFYEDDHEWSLENDTTNFKKESTMTKSCPNCNRMVPIGTVTCPTCGYVWVKQRREEMKEAIQVELVALNGFDVMEYALGKSFEELSIIQEIKGYKRGWIQHQITSLEDLKAYGDFMKYKPGWFYHAKENFNPKTIEEKRKEYEEYIAQKNSQGGYGQ